MTQHCLVAPHICICPFMVTLLSPPYLLGFFFNWRLITLQYWGGFGDGEGGGWEGQDGEHMYTHGWVMWIYGKNPIPFKSMLLQVLSLVLFHCHSTPGSRQNNSTLPRDVHTLIARSWKWVTLPTKGTVWMWLGKDCEMESEPVWSQESLKGKKENWRVSGGVMVMDAAFEPPEAGKGKDIYFPLGPPGGTQLCQQLDTLRLTSILWLPELQHIRFVSSCWVCDHLL